MIRLHNPQRTPITAAPRQRLAPAVVALAATLIVSQQPLAQVSVGGSGLPNVSVDFSVVDELGPAPSVPEVLRGFRSNRRFRAAATPLLRMPRFPDIRHMKDGRPLGRVVLKRPSSLSKPLLRKPTLRKPSKPRRRAAAAPARPRAVPRPPVIAKPKAVTAAPPAMRAPVAVMPVPMPPPPAPAIKKPRPIAKAAPKKAPGPRRQPPAKTARRMPPPKPVMVPKPPPVAPPPPPKIATAPMPAPPIPEPPVTARISPPEIKPAVTVKPIPAKPVSAPKPPKQVASLPPKARTIAPGESLRLTFPAGAARLTPESSRKLSEVAKTLSGDAKLRLQLLAYAGGSSETASQARRLSLSRALTARSFLIGKGVRSTRIDVRALGNKSGGGPPDRIDVLVTKR
jgi:outer membrane protein OmpA-like peptidoglycan-associated protein